MKILIVHEIDWIKKVPFEPHHLAEIFSLKGHDVFVINCAEPDISKIWNGMFTTVTANYHRLYDDASITLIQPSSILIKGLNRATYFLTCKRIIKKILIENNIDIILLYGVATNGIQCVELSKELKIPLVFRSLDVAHELVRIPILRNIVKKYEKKIIKNADRVLSTTPELVRYAKEMSANNNTEYFPLGINPQIFKPTSKSASLADQFGIRDSNVVIGFIGTIYSFAGLDFILNQFHLLKNQIQGIKFLIVGGGPDFERIKSLVKKLSLESDIILTGFVKQEKLHEYISLFDICVNPFVINKITDRIIPTKILEYMACRKPVLSTPLKGTIELLPDETFGIVYSPLSDFIPTIVELSNNKEKLIALGNNGFSYIEKNHYWDSLVNKLIDMFQQIIKNYDSNRV